MFIFEKYFIYLERKDQHLQHRTLQNWTWLEIRNRLSTVKSLEEIWTDLGNWEVRKKKVLMITLSFLALVLVKGDDIHWDVGYRMRAGRKYELI